MSTSNKQKHLTKDERFIILNGILNEASKKAIAATLGKDKSTIGKEIKLHRKQTYKCSIPLECSNYKRCQHGRYCTTDCIDYMPFKCSRRDRSPGACNGCKKSNHCRFDKFQYLPDIAHKEYTNTLINTRNGINATVNEIKTLGNVLKPLLEQGLSIYHILQNHPEIQLCEKTIYTYIDDSVFKDAGINIDNTDLRRKVNRKINKKISRTYKKREDHKYLKDRKYVDFLAYLESHPNASVVEMDTVYNDISHGPFLQTFKFRKYGFLFALLHQSHTQEAMISGVQLLEDILGTSLFKKTVEVLLTDRGSEFKNPQAMEYCQNDTRRTYVFYCDPMCSHQKGSIENNHIELRYILPKQTNLTTLGLSDQEQLNKVLSHVNSFSKEALEGKSALEMLSFLNSELHEKFIKFGIKMISPKDIILKPYLIKR